MRRDVSCDIDHWKMIMPMKNCNVPCRYIWRRIGCANKYNMQYRDHWKKHSSKRSCDEPIRGKLKNMYMRS
jgi:hypothetical protein